MVLENEVAWGLGASSGIIVLLLKQVHLQNEAGARQKELLLLAGDLLSRNCMVV